MSTNKQFTQLHLTELEGTSHIHNVYIDTHMLDSVFIKLKSDEYNHVSIAELENIIDVAKQAHMKHLLLK